MNNQFLLPGSQLNLCENKEYLFIDNLLDQKKHSVFDSGKDIIRYLTDTFKLKIDDEVYISTTAESSFVSSCITCTLFNFCKVSRVLTEKTKLIYVIHEFGFPNVKIDELCKIAKEKRELRLNGRNVLVDYGIRKAINEGINFFDFRGFKLAYIIQNIGVTNFKESFNAIKKNIF